VRIFHVFWAALIPQALVRSRSVAADGVGAEGLPESVVGHSLPVATQKRLRVQEALQWPPQNLGSLSASRQCRAGYETQCLHSPHRC